MYIVRLVISTSIHVFAVKLPNVGFIEVMYSVTRAVISSMTVSKFTALKASSKSIYSNSSVSSSSFTLLHVLTPHLFFLVGINRFCYWLMFLFSLIHNYLCNSPYGFWHFSWLIIPAVHWMLLPMHVHSVSFSVSSPLCFFICLFF